MTLESLSIPNFWVITGSTIIANCCTSCILPFCSFLIAPIVNTWMEIYIHYCKMSRIYYFLFSSYDLADILSPFSLMYISISWQVHWHVLLLDKVLLISGKEIIKKRYKTFIWICFHIRTTHKQISYGYKCLNLDLFWYCHD